MSDLKKRGTIKRTIKYLNRDGEEKNQYISVGDYFSTDHGNRQAIKLYATATSDEVWLNIYPDEDKPQDSRPMPTSTVMDEAYKDKLPNDSEADKPIDLTEIPF